MYTHSLITNLIIYFTEETPSSKRKKVTPVGINVAFPFQAADTSDVIKISRCFSGKEICILNGTKTVSKHELERKIVSGGGEIVQNPGIKMSAFFIGFCKGENIFHCRKLDILHDRRNRRYPS